MSFRRRFPFGLLPALILLASVLSASAVRAQFASDNRTGVFAAGESVNLFLTWEGSSALQRFEVALPVGWTIEDATILGRGMGRIKAEIQAVEAETGRYVVSPAHPLRGMHEVVLRAETAPVGQVGTWSVTPFVATEVSSDAGVEAAPGLGETGVAETTVLSNVTGNRVLDFASSLPGLVLLSDDWFGELGANLAGTVELWLRTTGLDQIVLSTWDGDEERPYFLELVTAPTGELLVYRGQPGQHISMSSADRISDGGWHHVAVTNDPVAGWFRLFIDGEAVDSLVTEFQADLDYVENVALGGRLLRADEEEHEVRPDNYVGQIDEIRFWPGAKEADQVRQHMRQEWENGRDGVAVLGFDGGLPGSEVGSFERVSTKTSTLAFYEPVRRLYASVAERGIELTWESSDPQTTFFEVERSEDGEVFESISTIQSPYVDGSQDRFEFVDALATGRVYYYRLKQVFRNSGVHRTPAVKVGLGDSDDHELTGGIAVLVGNFPNPFNTSTNINFELTETESVTLSVWDLSGQRVAMLVDDVLGPGLHEVTFVPGDLPSGTYFVQLQATDFVTTRKVILAR